MYYMQDFLFSQSNIKNFSTDYSKYIYSMCKGYRQCILLYIMQLNVQVVLTGYSKVDRVSVSISMFEW